MNFCHFGGPSTSQRVEKFWDVSRFPTIESGDVNFDSVYREVKAVTPVPGGVGPMTIACLMFNTLVATQIQNTISPFPWNELHTKLNMKNSN